MAESLIDLSRLQFAVTAMFHWIFVPLTLGLGFLIAFMETKYVRTGDEFWKRTTKFWMKLFGINFAIGVATGIILEFEFGTNWSNYSWFVGDIFGAPLAIEGIFAFFMESVFIAVMFFGWNRVSKRFHLTATWLTAIGANLSALWILVANAWMQYPAGMAFNPDTARNEMVDFWAIIFSPVAINKFFHTVTSGYVLASVFVIGISAWFLLKKRETEFAVKSMRIAAIFGLCSALALAYTGDGSAKQVADKQPMKLAAMEGLYEGKTHAPLVAFGLLNHDKKYGDAQEPLAFKIELPGVLSWLSFGHSDAYVPGINNIIEGGYTYEKDGQQLQALPISERMERGKLANAALADYQAGKEAGDQAKMDIARQTLEANFQHFGYGYFKSPEDAIPNIPLTFYSFHVMVMLGGFFIVLFALTWFLSAKKWQEKFRWMQYVQLWSIPLAYLAGMLGWVVAEVGRQPWTIQDLLPVSASVSGISSGAVRTTLILFLVLFSILLIAEIGIMLKQIKKGPAPQSPKGE